MNNFPIKCSLCMTSYDEAQIPRNLRCGHSVCTACVKQKLINEKYCPECRERHHVDTTTNLPINYPLTRLMRSHANGEIKLTDKVVQQPLVEEVTSLEVEEDAGKCPSHGDPMRFLCVTCSSWVCRDCLVTDHRGLPRGSCKILGITDAMKQIKMEHQRRSDLLVRDMKSGKRKLEPEASRHDICRKYCRLNGRSHKRMMAQIDKGLEDIKNKDEETVTLLMGQLDQLTTTMCKTTSPVEVTTSCKELINCQENWENHLAQQKEKKEPLGWDILDHLRMDLKTLMSDIQKPFYVVHQEGGDTRCSLVTPSLRNKGLLLYSLKDSKPPQDGIVLPFGCVRDLVPTEDATVFFEIGWGNEIQGRVYVLLFIDSFLGRQTLPLISGEKGNCFRNTCFYQCDSRILHGGDFANNDGTGKVPRGIGNYGEEHEERSLPKRGAGLLEVDRLYKNKLYFHLESSRYSHRCPVGKVTQGLEILQAASRVTPIEHSGIKDCGMVIPLWV